MNRAFRVPILPALQGAARARFSSATTSQSNTNNNSGHPVAAANRAINSNGDAASQPQQNAELKKQSNKTINETMKSELMRVKSHIDSKLNLKDVQNLVHVHAMMEIYRRYRDTEGNVCASEPIHAILQILRLRSQVLKPVISKVRQQIMGSQNEVLSKYLNEIADDLVAGRSYASHFALTYLLTAFSTMEKHAQASEVWKKLKSTPPTDSSNSNNTLVEKLQDPRVVSAALRTSDPSVVSLQDFENTYKETTERNGRYLLADEALAIGYLRFKEYSNAVKMYASMCDHYDVTRWETSLIRLHNIILTECTDITIADVFFEAAVSEESFINLHPSAAASYLKHLYSGTGDVNRVVSAYERAMYSLKTQKHDYGVPNCINLVAECLKCVVQQEFALTGPTKEAKALIERIYKDQDQLVLNTVLSMVSKTWTAPEYIVELQQLFPAVPDMEFDAVRILLNSSQQLSIEQCDIPRVDELWKHLLKLKAPVLFDWLSLAKACDNAERVPYLVESFKSHKLNKNAIKGLSQRLNSSPIAKRALNDANLLDEDIDSRDNRFSTVVVDSELKQRSEASRVAA